MTLLRLFFVAMPLFLLACQHSPNYPLTVIHQSNQCAVVKPTVKLIGSKAELQRYMQSHLIVPNKPKQPADAVAMAEQTVVLVAAGQQPTAGYGYKVASDMANFDATNNTVTLPIEFIQPSKSNLQAQVLTAPCVIVAVENLPESVNAQNIQISP